MNIFGRMAFGVVVCAVACSATAALAQFPKRPVEFVVSAAAGGGIDNVARMMAARIQTKWGKPVVVLNKPATAGALAEGYVANSTPDGHTILFVNQTRTVNAAVGGNKAGYDMVNGLAPITLIGKQPFVLVANKDLPAKSLPELVTLAKSKPNKLNYGDSGVGTSSDLAMKRLMQMTGTEIFEISYKTNAEVLVAVFSGEIDLEFGDVLTITPHIKAGKAKALAVADDVRSPIFPTTPAGTACFVSAGTPKEIIAQLNEDIVAIVKLPEIQDTLTRDGFQVIASKPEEFDKWIKEDTAVWRSVMDAFPSK